MIRSKKFLSTAPQDCSTRLLVLLSPCSFIFSDTCSTGNYALTTVTTTAVQCTEDFTSVQLQYAEDALHL